MNYTNKETAFIVKFTVCFVVAAIVLIGAGYAAISVLGSIDFSGEKPAAPTETPFVPTIDPQTTPDPTARIEIPPTPTPTPAPTPVPPCPFTMQIDMVDTSLTYYINLNLASGYSPQDMKKVVLSVWDGDMVYKNYTYDEAVFFGGEWKNSNGNSVLESGETFAYKVNGITLKIPADTEPKITFVTDGEIGRTVRMPSMKNPVTTPEYGDPSSGGSQDTPAYPPDNYFPYVPYSG